MKKNLDIKLMVLTTLFCVFIFPTGLFELDYKIPKLIFVSVFGSVYLYKFFKSKDKKKILPKKDLMFLIVIIVLTFLSKNINFLTFFPLIMMDDFISKKNIINDYIYNSNILYYCLIFTVIYSIIFAGTNGRYAFAAIKEINQSGLAIFCLSIMLLKKNQKIGIASLLFGLLTFSRSYFLAVFIYLVSLIKPIKNFFSKKKIMDWFNYFNLTIVTSIVLVLLGFFYVWQYKSGNIISDEMISNRLLNLLDYSNFFRFSAIIVMLCIFKQKPSKILLGMTDADYLSIGGEVSLGYSIPFRGIVPHNLFFSHLKIYGVFAIYEIWYLSKKIQKIISIENFFIYLAIVAYSIILGAGLYSYWLYLSLIMFIMCSKVEKNRRKNEKNIIS